MYVCMYVWMGCGHFTCSKSAIAEKTLAKMVEHGSSSALTGGLLDVDLPIFSFGIPRKPSQECHHDTVYTYDMSTKISKVQNKITYRM